MNKKQIIDITATPLTPSRQGRKCLGNGEHPEYECCCDECDYYLYCYPQYDWRLTTTDALESDSNGGLYSGIPSCKNQNDMLPL